MTFEEAKKILEKEGFYLIKFGGPSDIIKNPFSEYESPEIFEAGKVVNSAGYGVGMHSEVSNIRLYRLKKEYKTSTKAPGPGEEQPKEGNPALAESASQFNDALLDEQAKEIERLKKENAELLGIVERMKQDVKEVDYNFNAVCKENERLNEKIRELINEKTNLEDQITILNACKKHNDKIDRKQIKCLGKEIARLNGIIHDKNAILSDVAEELRLTKIREKNLVEVSQKYMKENEKLKKELADKTELVKIVRNSSKEYCDYGVAANEFIKELAHLYVLANNNGIINVEMLERCKNYQTYGFPANCNRETKKEINDIARGKDNKKPRIHTPELSEEELMKLQEKVCVDIAEEGADRSGVIVLCGKDFIDAIKKMK